MFLKGQKDWKALIAAVAGSLVIGSGLMAERLNVVASTPDIASIAESVGGERVSVTSLARGTEDPHGVRPRPSFPRILRQADLLIEGGAELEHGWLPQSIRSSRNAGIFPGKNGHVLASQDVDLIDAPLGPADRAQGHVHAAGNPHFLLDPENAGIVAGTIAGRLAEIDPEHASVYEENRKAFQQALDERIEEWKERLAPFEGTAVVTYHETFDYLARSFGFEIIGEIEPQPGAEPTPRHLAGLIRAMRDRKAPMIWVETYRPRRTADRVAGETGAVVLVMPDLVGGAPGIDNYFDLIEYNVSQIVEAMERRNDD